MTQGFYYNIQGPNIIGKSPTRTIYSVADQAEDHVQALGFIQLVNKWHENGLKRVDAWYPKLPRTPEQDALGRFADYEA